MNTGLIGIGAAIAFAGAAIAAALAQGRATDRAMEGIARQPEAAGDIRGTLIIALALMEAIAIYGLVLGILISGRITA